ncbi:MAG TPA: cytochrome c [Cyclobacteriaceae bacterium]|jgi:mono/diheme cytochrome c family protein|nr:cytochrome c [Cyclobacteriaceae bacterium]
MRLITNLVVGVSAAVALAGCGASGDNQGLEYAPNMYHSVAYEPLTQITDPKAGWYFEALDDRPGEFYNSNPYNPYKMNLRLPPKNTVRRTANGWLPYRGVNDADGLANANKLMNPIKDTTAVVLEQGKVLFETYCKHCHGAKGTGDGKVASGAKIDGVDHTFMPGVANLKSDAIKNVTEGHIFHVITYGKGLMGSHGSQVSEEDRWKIAKYVKELQKN